MPYQCWKKVFRHEEIQSWFLHPFLLGYKRVNKETMYISDEKNDNIELCKIDTKGQQHSEVRIWLKERTD